MAPASDGGSPITLYTLTASYGGEIQPCSAQATSVFHCVLTGLTNGHLYTVKVRASNTVGSGKAVRVQATPSSAVNCSFFGPNANLQGCDLTNADLTDRNLTGANLTNANLTGATLTRIFLNNANLTNANLTDALAFGIMFTGATLTNADMTNVSFHGVFSGGIIGTPSVLPPDFSLFNGYLIGPEAVLQSLNFTGANLAGVNLSHGFLHGINLTGANLTNANLANADLSTAILTDANLSGANLTGVSWSDTTCPDGTNSSLYSPQTCIGHGI